MNTIKSSDPDVLETRSGGGCVSLIGLPFLFFGLMPLLTALGVMHSSKGDAPRVVLAIMGLVFMSVGLAFLLGRAGTRINRRDRTVLTWWGLMAPLRRTERSLDEFNRVTLCREIRRSKNSTYTVYPVRLEGSGKPVSFGEPREYPPARKDAETVARFLDMKMVDSCGGEVVTRGADELDESLRDHVRRSGELPPVPEPPPNPRARCTIEGRRMIFDLPPRGITAGTWIQTAVAFVIPLVFLFAFILPLFHDHSSPTFFKVILFGFFGLFFILLPILAVGGSAFSTARRRVRIIASPESLIVEEHGLLRTKRTEIPSNELEELTAPSEVLHPQAGEPPSREVLLLRRLNTSTFGRGIQARSDKVSLEFGQDLPPEEIRWLYAVIRRVMVS